MTESSSPPRPTPPLPNPWAYTRYRAGFRPTLIAELNMMWTLNVIREKPNCEIQAQVVAETFHEEGEELEESFRMRDEQLAYVFEELKWYIRKRQDQVDRGVTALTEVGIECTRRCDGLIPEELKTRLLACVRKLEDLLDHLKDWHPGSDRQVLDLVHPSLFPFVAGRTHVTKQEAIPALEFIGSGDVVDETPHVGTKVPQFYSKKFKWLPTDFDVTSDGKVKARSYINNLHPVEHKEMYPILEEIIERFLPMFEEVLGDMRAFGTKTKRLIADTYGWYGEEKDYEDFEEEDDYYDYIANRVPELPTIPEFTPPEDAPKYDLRTGKRSLQLIVKLANIELTPENPKYEGGTWHENIVATGIYYYHTENITESRLDFRIQVAEPDYEQSDRNGIFDDGDALVQHLDGIVTKQDRCLVFPNIFQHQVQPFELLDGTKSGSRKILVFFLVNPEEEPVMSTTFVPPQQADWDPLKVMERVEPKLPLEVIQMIDRLADRPMWLEEAKRYREELMKERKFFVKTTNQEVFARPFSLCEH
ncbi:hypothetical protein BGX29_011415 [Mortierella sp. GBA35]|nr:hypothetical protein BGX29_011415 [Mortierella sp. GBA35]